MKHSKAQGFFTTAEAADLLLRQPQTLRIWAMTGRGPIKPIKVLGRLGWRKSDVQRLLDAGARYGTR